MRADMHRHNLVFLDEQFDGEPVTECDRERVQASDVRLGFCNEIYGKKIVQRAEFS